MAEQFVRSEERSRFERSLANGVAQLELAVPVDAVRRLGAHYELLVRWARRINLTTVTDPVDAAHRHALDSLLFAEALPEDDGSETVDVGSGAGFPGLVVALVRPQLRMVLLEPIRKRASFLRVAIAELKLSGAKVIEGKLQPTSGRVRPWPTDVVLSRATIPPLDLIERAAPVLRGGGRLIMSGGRGLPSTQVIAARAAEAGLIHHRRRAYVLPDGAPRWLDELRRPRDAETHHG